MFKTNTVVLNRTSRIKTKALGVPLVPFYDDDLEEDDEFYYDSSADTEDAELRAFRARKEEDDEDFQDSLDFEAERRLLRYQDHFYKGWAEEYFAGKWRYEEEESVEEEEWVELPSLFFESGSLFLFGKIENEMASNIISSIVLLNEEKENLDELTFFINSPGGFVKAGFAIFDMMQSCDLDLGLQTVGLGLVASTATLILCAGDQNYRGSFQHTRFMIHQPTGEFTLQEKNEFTLQEKKKKEKKDEKKDEKKKEKRFPKRFPKKFPTLPTHNPSVSAFTSYLDELLELRQRVIDIYVVATQKDADVISRDIERDFFMSAEGAHDYGLIDQVIGKREGDDESVSIDNLYTEEDEEEDPTESYQNFLQSQEDFDELEHKLAAQKKNKKEGGTRYEK